MLDKKYELTSETKDINVDGVTITLYRIKSLKSFRCQDREVYIGDLGGWIENLENLSQQNKCWVFDDARVYGNAEVYDSAQAYGNAWICDNAKVYGNAKIYNRALVCDNAKVYGKAEVCDDAWVCDDEKLVENQYMKNRFLELCKNIKRAGVNKLLTWLEKVISIVLL